MGVEKIDYSSDGEYQLALAQEEADCQQQQQEEKADYQYEWEQECMEVAKQKTEKEKLKVLKSKAMEHAVNPLILKCQKCDLYKTKKKYVLGKGNTSAKIFFVGEAPGKEEDKQGEPFVGNAGIILDLLLEEAGFKKEDYYISNVLKCRPPNNRSPEKNEITACREHLINEINTIQPEYIICLGTYAVTSLFNYFSISNSIAIMKEIHGQLFKGINPNAVENGKFKQVNLIPMYHPAAGLYKPELRGEMLADMNRLYTEINYQVIKKPCNISF